MAPVPADIALASYCILVAVGGLAANGCVLVLILSSKELRNKDYIIFILNRALTDFVYCFLLGVGHPTAILTESLLVCQVVGFIDVCMAVSSMFIEPFLACNRYISIFHTNLHKKVYTVKNVQAMCILLWVIGVISTTPHIFTGSLGRAKGTVCCVSLTRDSVLVTVVAQYIPVMGCAISVGVFNYKIFRFLKNHSTQQMTNAQRTKLQSDREMLRFILVSAFLPLTLQIPLVIAFWVAMFSSISDWALFVVTVLFVSMFMVNPMITVFMVKPLRSQFTKHATRFMKKNKQVHAVVTVNSIQINSITHPAES